MKTEPLASSPSWLNRHAMAIVSLVILLAYAGFIHWFWGWGEVLSLWNDAGWPVLGLALVLLLATHALRAWRIRDYFPEATRGRFPELFRLTQLHNLLNVMLPLRSGEVSFPLLMRREFGLPVARTLSALLVMRLLDLHALLAAAGLGLALGAGTVWVWLLWLAFLLLPAIGFLLRKPALRFAIAVLPPRAGPMLAEVAAGLPADAAGFARAWIATLVNWFTKVAVLAWILGLLADIPVAARFGGALGGELSSVLPLHAPAGVGTYPGAIAAGALAFGADPSSASVDALARAAVNAHLLVVVSALAGTALSLLAAGRR